MSRSATLDALARARRGGLRIALVTGEEGPLVMAIAAKAGAEFVLPAAKDKVAALEALSANAAVPLARICFVGDADRDALAFPLVIARNCQLLTPNCQLSYSEAIPSSRKRFKNVG